MPDADGKLHSLADFKGRWLVLFFYPGDFTPGCTVESCAFRDAYDAFKDLGAEVVGISGDSRATHAAFAAEHQLPYLLLSDPGRIAARAYGVPHILGRLSGRSSFVIGPDGLLLYIFDSRSEFTGHVEKPLAFLKSGL